MGFHRGLEPRKSCIIVYDLELDENKMKRYIFGLFFLLTPILIFGQDDFFQDDLPIASNPRLLAKEKRMLVRLDSLLATDAPLQQHFRAYNALAWFYLNSFENYQQATLYNETTLAYNELELFPRLHGEALTIKGRILESRGLFAASVKAHVEALEIKEQLKDTARIAFSYQSIGRTFRRQRRYQEALDYLLKSVNLYEQINKPHPKTLQLVGRTYQNIEDYDNAVLYYNRAYNLASQRKHKGVMASSLSGLANIAYARGDYPKSLELLERVVELKNRQLTTNEQIGIWRGLARNYLAMGEIAKAKTYNEKCLEHARAIESVGWEMYLLDETIEINKQLGAEQAAIAQLELQRELKDSIFDLENLRLSADYQTLYETREKEKQVFEQQKIISEQVTARNRMIGVFGLCSLFALGGFLFYRNNVRYQRELTAKNAEIQQQKIQELEQQQKILAMSAMIEGQEAERMRIAKDLHDGIGGLLTSVKAHFTSIEQELEKIRSFNLYEKTNALIDEACVEVRRISHNMVPHALTLSGLGGALEGIATQLETQGIQCDLDTNATLQSLDETKAVMIYRIVQELVNNIQKHANASNVLLQVLAFPDFIQILVEDDGKGFDSESSDAKKGLGLKSIASRVNYLNGTLQYDSVLGTGTTVSIEIPSV